LWFVFGLAKMKRPTGKTAARDQKPPPAARKPSLAAFVLIAAVVIGVI
jgi:hypothetical protein